MISLQDKTVFITGATAGIGLACAESFASLGARLILTARREEKLDEISKVITGKYEVECLSTKLDVCDKEAVQDAVESLPDDWKDIDILINNAGLALGTDPIHEADPVNWETMIDTNVKGLLYVSRSIIPGMVERGSGQIINLSSIAGHQVYQGGNVYCATKHAVDALTKALQIELVATPIRVSSVSPGMVETEFSTVRFFGDKTKADAVYEGIEALTAEDVADAVAFCASRPSHVNINDIIIMPTNQACVYALHRKS